MIGDFDPSVLMTPEPGFTIADGLVEPYKWLAIDGGGLATTAWATHKGLESEHLRVQATVYVFVTTLASLSRLVAPNAKILVAFDGKDNRAWRRGRHPWYKHGRGSAVNRAEIGSAIYGASSRTPGIVHLLEAIGAGVRVIPGREADDIVATACQKISDAGKGPVLIFSDDKDYVQMVSDDIHLARRSMNGMIMTPNFCGVMDIPYGIHYLHQKAMMGDPGDNVKGLHGIGERKALELLAAVPNALDIARTDPDMVDWSVVPDGVRRAFVRAGRDLLFPAKLCKELEDGTNTLASEYEFDDDDCLTAAMYEAARCLDLVELDRDMELEKIPFPEPNVEKIPKILRDLGLGMETDLVNSLFALAGVRSPSEPRTSAVRAAGVRT